MNTHEWHIATCPTCGAHFQVTVGQGVEHGDPTHILVTAVPS